MIIKVTINGTEYEVKDGETILNVCSNLGIFIPQLCYLKGASPTGMCGLCCVEVTQNDSTQPALACSTFISPKISIVTESPNLTSIRKQKITQIFEKHNIECFTCSGSENCVLKKFCGKIFSYWDQVPLFQGKIKKSEIINLTDDLTFDQSKCINCQRCHKFLNMSKDPQASNLRLFDLKNSSSYNDLKLNVVNVCPTAALSIDREILLTCDQKTTFDVSDPYTPEILTYSRDNRLVRISLLNSFWIKDSTRLLFKEQDLSDEEGEDKFDYKKIIDRITQNISSSAKKIFVLGEYIDILTFGYIKYLERTFENVLVYFNNSHIPEKSNFQIGLKNLDLFFIDFALLLGEQKQSQTDHLFYHINNIKTKIFLDINNLDSFFDSSNVVPHYYPCLFVFSNAFNNNKNLTLDLEKFEKKYFNQIGKKLTIRIIPETSSELLISHFENYKPITDLFENYNKHDVDFLLNFSDIKNFENYNKIFLSDNIISVKTKKFWQTEGEFYLDIFDNKVQTQKIIQSPLKTKSEFFFDLLKNLFRENFDKINSDIHKTIREEFF